MKILDYFFHCVKFAALGHADSFVSPIRLFHESWGMESSSTASPGAIGLDFVTDEILSEYLLAYLLESVVLIGEEGKVEDTVLAHMKSKPLTKGDNM